MGSRRLLAALVLLATACTSGATGEPGDPEATVAGWLDAVERLDLEQLSSFVRDDHVVLLLAAANRFDAEATGELLSNGVSLRAQQEFWSSFKAGFVASAGREIDGLTIVGSEAFVVGDVEFAAVRVAFPEEPEAELISRLEGTTWRLDLLATSGPALVRQLRQVIDSAGSDQDELVDHYEDWTMSLRAGLIRQPGRDLPAEFAAELERLIERLRG